MAPGDVIDLLSSDDDAPLEPPNRSDGASTINAQSKSDFLYLSDDFDSIVRFDNGIVGARPAKRRRLSPSATSGDTISLLPQLPRVKRATLPKTESKQANRDRQSVDESDPIVFTSSLGAASRVKETAIEVTQSHKGYSDDSLPDDLLSAPLRHSKAARALSERTAALLESLSQPASCQNASTSSKRSNDKVTERRKPQSKGSVEKGLYPGSEEDIEGLAKGVKAPSRTKLTDEEKAAKDHDKGLEKAARAKERDNAKAARKEQRAKEKEEDQVRKWLLKDEKAREKRIAADLAEVNKLKLDKKDSTPEMIVDLPATIAGQSVDTQIRETLRNLGVDAALYQSPIPNVIRWRRKMKARWNAELDHWDPIERMEIHDEKHVMCLISAKELIGLATAQQDDQDLETHVAMLKSAYSDCVPIYMIEGLHIWLRKNKTAENRAYQARVLSQAQADDYPTASQQAASKRKKPVPEIIDEDMIEDALLRLQVMHQCLVHHTHTSVETAEWVANFTQHISTIPYRFIIHAEFYMLF
jgi:crossover junction endonuclease EME1